MLRINRDVEYALICLVYMYQNPSVKHTAKELAHNFAIPRDLLNKIMRSLRQKGILKSVLGVKGGYLLNHTAKELTFLDVITALQGKTALTPCLAGVPDCRQRTKCNIRGNMKKVQQVITAMLESLSVKEYMDSGQVGKA